MSGTGTALVVRSPNDVALEERSWESPQGLEVRIVPAHVGLCGTDAEIISGDMDPDYVRYPLVLGHEWSGRVAQIGGQVTRVQPGDAVVVEGIIPCSVCEACRTGATNLCSTYDELGFVRDGAAGPSVTVPEHLVHRLEPSVPLEAGALVEPASVVWRGLSTLQIPPGQDVLVVGDGTVGLLAVALVRLHAPARVVVAGLRDEQVALARRLGADELVVGGDHSRGFDLVVEAAGSTRAVDVALRSARRGGQVLLLGISGHGRTVDLAPDDIVNNDLLVRGSFGYTAQAWAHVVQLLNSGHFDPIPLITHRFPLSSYRDALEALSAPANGPRGKVLLALESST